MQNPLGLLLRAVRLWFGDRVRFERNLTDIQFEDGGDVFRAFRKVVVDPADGRPARGGTALRVRFRFRNLSAAANRRLSAIPIPLIVAQPGFRSKTWLLGLKTGEFMGLYAFDTVEAARAYLNSLPLKMMWRRAAAGTIVHEISESTKAQDPRGPLWATSRDTRDEAGPGGGKR